MEDIDCQPEQLIAPNKLQMFCMYSYSKYLFMWSIWKRKPFKRFSSSSFIAVLYMFAGGPMQFLHFFFLQFFFCFAFPPTQQQAWKQPAAQVLLRAFADHYVFCSFLVLLKHICTTVEKVPPACATPTSTSAVKMGKNCRTDCEMASHQCESPINRITNCRWGRIKTRLLGTCGDDDVRRWVTVFVPCLNLRAANPPLLSLVWPSVTRGRQLIGRCGLFLITTDSAW